MAQRHGDTITSPSWCISGALHHGAPRGRVSPFTSNHSRHALVSPLGFLRAYHNRVHVPSRHDGITGYSDKRHTWAFSRSVCVALFRHSSLSFITRLPSHTTRSVCSLYWPHFPASSSYFWDIHTNILRGLQAKSPRSRTLPYCRVSILCIHHDACVLPQPSDIEQPKTRATVKLTRMQTHLHGSCFYG